MRFQIILLACFFIVAVSAQSNRSYVRRIPRPQAYCANDNIRTSRIAFYISSTFNSEIVLGCDSNDPWIYIDTTDFRTSLRQHINMWTGLNLDRYYRIIGNSLKIKFINMNQFSILTNRLAGFYICGSNKYEVIIYEGPMCDKTTANATQSINCTLNVSSNKESIVRSECVYDSLNSNAVQMNSLDFGSSITYEWQSEYIEDAEEAMCKTHIYKCTSGYAGPSRTFVTYFVDV